MNEDAELLRQYVAGSESAFAELVSRHLPLVFSAALRQLGGDHELAKDVAQLVFIDLARKGRSLQDHQVLTGWLYTSTRFAAHTARRSEYRRQVREQKAITMQSLTTADDPNHEWEKITPVLDEVMHELKTEDRVAVLLRFFEGQDLKHIGANLGISEDAARMRLARAMEKLHSLLSARGIALSSAALGTLIAAGAVSAAPAGLAHNITGAALTNAAAAGGNIFQPVRQVLAKQWKRVVVPGAVLIVTGTIGAYLGTHPLPQKDAAPNPRTSAADSPLPDPKESLAAAAPIQTPDQTPRMSFHLVDAETGAPIGKAKLHIASFREGGEGKSVKSETDLGGTAIVENPQKPYRGVNLFVTADGHVPKVVMWPGELPDEYTMKLESGSTIGGTVVDESRQPVSGVKIEFQGRGNVRIEKENIQFGPDTAQVTDTSGRWFCNMIPRTYEKIHLILTHPDFAVTRAEAPANTAEATQTVLVIKKGIAVAGVVEDINGQPLKGATVRQVHNFAEPRLSATTDDSGRFEFKHVRSGELTLVVQAPGFAPALQETNVAENSIELRFALESGNILTGRVVDEAGAPITNAVAQTDFDNQGLRKIEWSVRTDHQGKFEWNSAPAEPLLYWFEAEGFNWVRQTRLKADGTEHQIVLTRKLPAVTSSSPEVTGTVVDEASGLPLADFRVLFAEVRHPQLPLEFSFATEGKNGKFRLPLRSPHFQSYQIQIQKEGYLPIVATNLLVKDGSQSLQLKLKKGSGPSGWVVLPGGDPATNATVFLYETSGGVYIDQPGHVRKDLGDLPDNRTTDEEGKFSFAPKLDPRGFIVIHELGFADVPIASFNGKIVLQPWGRVEGKCSIGNQPGPEAKIQLSNMMFRYGQNGRNFPALSLNLETVTDAEGNFVFEKVPPGERKIFRRVSKPGSQLGRIYETQGRPIVVAAGTTTRVHLGGTGRTIAGRASFPSGTKSVDWKTVAAELKLQLITGLGSRPQPESFSSNQDFSEAMKVFAEADRTFWTSDRGLEMERAQRSYAVFCSEDGSFMFGDIPPGNYELKIEISEPKQNSLGPSGNPLDQAVVGSLVTEITVNEIAAGEAAVVLDLGNLELQPVTVRHLGYR